MTHTWQIFEFKTEEMAEYDNAVDAYNVFNNLKRNNIPGIWQLYMDRKELLEEFVGALNLDQYA